MLPLITYNNSTAHPYSIKELIVSDYYQYYRLARTNLNEMEGGGNNLLLKALINALLCKNHCAAILFWWRLTTRKNWLYYVGKYKYWRLSRKYGVQLCRAANVGPGFYMGHGVGVVINAGTLIGQNCTISQFLSIGTTKRTPAIIGDNVYIGPGVCIVEDVKIGNNTKIGAGAVVTRDVPDGATAVGVPNRNIMK